MSSKVILTGSASIFLTNTLPSTLRNTCICKSITLTSNTIAVCYHLHSLAKLYNTTHTIMYAMPYTHPHTSPSLCMTYTANTPHTTHSIHTLKDVLRYTHTHTHPIHVRLRHAYTHTPMLYTHAFVRVDQTHTLYVMSLLCSFDFIRGGRL